jgi:hypothetical protein
VELDRARKLYVMYQIDQYVVGWLIVVEVIIVGLSLGLFGYDNAFVSPLVSLPLFVEKYQGLGFDGSLVFTVFTCAFVIEISLKI